MRELLGCNQATEYNNNNNYNGGGAIMNNCNGPRSSKSEGGGASGDNSSSFRGADVQNSGRVINYDAPPAGQGQQGSSSNNPAAKRQRNDSRERPQEQQPGGGRIVPFGQQHGAPVTLSDVESWVKTEITKALEEISDPPKYVVEGGELLVTQAEANGCKEVMKDLDLKNIAKKLPQTVLAELLQLNPISGPIQRNIQMLKNLIGKAAKSVFKYWNRGDVANTISAAIGFRQNGDANGTIAVMSILFLKKMQKENHPDIVNAE
ncbi:unnamed protein product [Amoebophrya sp. A25]|nr:unnamed protein product [Amoebophrya sp. A25]|eukprot:GSA25T00008612001.1